MRKYSHLSKDQRSEIFILHSKGYSLRDIAKALTRSPSTISREIRRNRRKIKQNGSVRDGPYVPRIAHHKAYLRRKSASYKSKKIVENYHLQKYIIAKLKKQWSPDAISGRMKLERASFYASKTAIYEWLHSSYAQYWCKFLHSQRYYPKKRKAKKQKKTLIPNRKGLGLRPKGASNRTRYGHFEGDTIVSAKKTGSKASLVVLYERKTRYISAQKIDSLKPAFFNIAVEQMQSQLSKILSLSLDNGIENTKYEQLKIPAYFCDAYASWQKGGVENANKQIRKFIPKGSDIADYSNNHIKTIISILNNKPRKSLNYKTPYEVMINHNLLKNYSSNDSS